MGSRPGGTSNKRAVALSVVGYGKEVAELKKKAALLQRGIVNLDIKVKKWVDVPEHVSAFYGGAQSAGWSALQKADGLRAFRSADVSVYAIGVAWPAWLPADALGITRWALRCIGCCILIGCCCCAMSWS